MRINEIITESTELEEGWKSKLGAAALAGAAMLGGGQTAHAQNRQPTAQTQQVNNQAIRALEFPGNFGMLGMLKPYKDAGLLSPDQLKFYNKMFDMYIKQFDSNPFFRLHEKSFNSNYNKQKNLASDIVNKLGGEKLKTLNNGSNLEALLRLPFNILRGVDQAVTHELQQKQAERNSAPTKPPNYAPTVVDQRGSQTSQSPRTPVPKENFFE